MPVFFIQASQVQNGAVCVTGPLLNHLRASLRIRPGEELWLGDERRRRYRVRVTSLGRQELTGQVLEERSGPPVTWPTLLLGQCLLKGERMEWVIQKATELGAAGLVPMISSRSVVRPQPDRVAGQRERWQRIALEAAQQSERWEVPEVAAPCEAREFFLRGSRATLALILSERGPGKPLSSIALPAGPAASLAVAVGPEGGWTGEELEAAVACGFVPATLGKRILRAETAVLAALSILQSRLGELG
ncbi:RsmE family RNA methyltransferase [Nitrospira sp. Kam-Ns4a]